MTTSGGEPDRDELERLLKEAGSAFDPEGVEALIDGVLAAPVEVGTSWHALVADPMTPTLTGKLDALQAEKAQAYHNGLSPEDFDRLPRAERLERLRQELTSQGLDGFIVPRADEHQGEYVPTRGQRLAWLTGFTGSAGVAIVLRSQAALFVDGRYTLQAAAQADTQLFEIRHLIDEPPSRWIGTALTRGAVLGTIPGCILLTMLSGCTPPPKKPAHHCAQLPRTLSTSCGRGGRQRRLRRSCRTPTASPARALIRSARDWDAP